MEATRLTKMYHQSARTKEGNTYKYIKTFSPLPWQIKPWQDTSRILLLTGSAGGGKSILAAEKVHGFCLRYPNARVMILRKTKDSAIKTVITPILERRVIGSDPRVRHMRVHDRFEYTNGSLLMYEGMNDDNALTRIRTHSLDMIWLEEATEFSEEDFNELLARLRGSAAPWTQIILTTNPDGPLHWINLRLLLGEDPNVAKYFSGAQDNPYNPPEYIETLKMLTGVQYDRLVLGKWVLSSGIIFDTWNDNYTYNKDTRVGNVRDDAEYIPGGGPIIWAVDDGYSGEVDKKTGMFTARSHPRAILIAQRRHTGQLAIFYESYRVGILAEDHIRDVLREGGKNDWPRPSWVIRDRAAASLAGAFAANGITKVKYNTIDVDESIKEMRGWLAPDHNDFARVVVHPRCRYLRYEMSQYSKDKNGKIIKEHDNGVDALRYLIWDEAYGKSPTVDIVSWNRIAKRHAGLR